MSEHVTIAPTNLPSNISNNSALPASLAQCQRLDRALAPFAKWPRLDFHYPSRQTIDKVAAQVRDLWPEVNRRATLEEIALNVGALVACFPDRRTEEERRVFQHLLLNDVANAAPSLYALQAGCERLRLKFRFQQLQIADVIAAVDQGKAKSKRTRQLIEAIPHMHKSLDWIEQKRREQERQRDPRREALLLAAYLADEEADARRRLRQRIEWYWPPLNPNDYKADELRRLGLSGIGFDELQELEQSDVLARLDEADRLAEAEQNAENDDE